MGDLKFETVDGLAEKPDFVAIDFETAVSYRVCAVAVVSVKNGEIVDEFYTLVRPRGNYYNYHNTRVHGITAADTEDAPNFRDIYPVLRNLLYSNVVVAHNESFDRRVLQENMREIGLSYGDLCLPDCWECTLKIYRQKGFKPANLKACADRMGIELNHHEALSDARACARLYLMK